MKTIKNSILFFLGTICAIILFEFLLTFGGVLEPSVKLDPQKGQRYIPNHTCNSIFINEGFGLSRVNSEGWFGRDPKKKDISEINIAVLGNSFVAARQIFERDHFITLTQEKINSKNPSKKIALYNYGKESVALNEELFIKEEVDSTLKPDYYVLLVNDLLFGNQGRMIPFYEIKEGQLTLNTSFKNNFLVKKEKYLKPLMRSSVLFLLFRVKNRIPEFFEILTNTFEYKTDIEDNSIIESLEPTYQMILKKLSEDPRIIFLLDVSPEKMKEVNAILKDAKQVNLRKILKEYQQKNLVDLNYWPLIQQHGHWNRAGHKVVADGLTNELSKIILH